MGSGAGGLTTASHSLHVMCGWLNQTLYKLGNGNGNGNGVVDVTQGNNDIGPMAGRHRRSALARGLHVTVHALDNRCGYVQLGTLDRTSACPAARLGGGPLRRPQRPSRGAVIVSSAGKAVYEEPYRATTPRLLRS